MDSVTANLIACMEVKSPRGSFVPSQQVVQKDYRKENPLIIVESYRAGNEKALKCCFLSFLGYLLFKEEGIKERLLGSLVMVGGVALIAFS